MAQPCGVEMPRHRSSLSTCSCGGAVIRHEPLQRACATGRVRGNAHRDIRRDTHGPQVCRAHGAGFGASSGTNHGHHPNQPGFLRARSHRRPSAAHDEAFQPTANTCILAAPRQRSCNQATRDASMASMPNSEAWPVLRSFSLLGFDAAIVHQGMWNLVVGVRYLSRCITGGNRVSSGTASGGLGCTRTAVPAEYGSCVKYKGPGVEQAAGPDFPRSPSAHSLVTKG